LTKNSIELISKCAKTRLHQCRILKKLASLTSASRGRRAWEGAAGEWQREE